MTSEGPDQDIHSSSDRFKRGLKTQCMLAKHAQTLLCMPDMYRFFYFFMKIPQEKNIESQFPHIKKGASCGVFYDYNLLHNSTVSIDNICSTSFFAFFFLHKEKSTVKSNQNECTLSPS